MLHIVLLVLIQLITTKYVSSLREITVCQDNAVKHRNRKEMKIVDVLLGSIVNLECHIW